MQPLLPTYQAFLEWTKGHDTDQWTQALRDNKDTTPKDPFSLFDLTCRIVSDEHRADVVDVLGRRMGCIFSAAVVVSILTLFDKDVYRLKTALVLFEYMPNRSTGIKVLSLFKTDDYRGTIFRIMCTRGVYDDSTGQEIACCKRFQSDDHRLGFVAQLVQYTQHDLSASVRMMLWAFSSDKLRLKALPLLLTRVGALDKDNINVLMDTFSSVQHQEEVYALVHKHVPYVEPVPDLDMDFSEPGRDYLKGEDDPSKTLRKSIEALVKVRDKFRGPLESVGHRQPKPGLADTKSSDATPKREAYVPGLDGEDDSRACYQAAVQAEQAALAAESAALQYHRAMVLAETEAAAEDGLDVALRESRMALDKLKKDRERRAHLDYAFGGSVHAPNTEQPRGLPGKPTHPIGGKPTHTTEQTLRDELQVKEAMIRSLEKHMETKLDDNERITPTGVVVPIKFAAPVKIKGEDDPACEICFAHVYSAAFRKCGHATFCIACAVDWVETHTTCPKCNQKAVRVDLNYL